MNRPWLPLLRIRLYAFTAAIFFMATPVCAEDNASGLPGSLASDYAGVARSAALASSHLAGAQGTDALYDNPAGLAFAGQPEISLLHVNLFENTWYDFLGVIYPAPELGTFGLGWARLVSQGFELRDANDQWLGSFDDIQNTAFLVYGRQLIPGLGIGSNLKLAFHDIYQNRLADMFLDAAVRYDLDPSLRTAVLLRNLLYLSLTPGKTPDPVPVIFRLGVAWTPDLKMIGLNPLSFYLAIDNADFWNQRLGFQTPVWGWRLGLEYEVYAGVRVLAGLEGERQTLGLSIPYHPFTLQYAFDLRPLGAVHWVSLAYVLGERADPQKVQWLQQESFAALQRKDYPQALALNQQLLQMDPGNRIAQACAEETRRVRDKEAAALGAAARNAYHEQSQEKAEALCQQVLALDPEDKAAAQLLAQIEKDRQAAEQARREAETARLMTGAEEFYQQSRWMEAIQAWEQVLQLTPQHAGAQARLEASKNALASNVDHYFSHGVLLIEKNRYPEAKAQFALVLKITPDHLLAKHYLEKVATLESVFYQRLYTAAVQDFRDRRLEGALKGFQRIHAWNPAFKQTTGYLQQTEAILASLQTALSAYARSLQAYQQGQLDQAAASLASVLDQSDQWTAEMHALQRRIEQDQSAYAKALDAGLQAFQRSELANAVALLVRARALNRQGEASRSLAQAYTAQGILAYRQDRLSEAIQAWEHSLSVWTDPTVNRYIKRARHKQSFIKENVHAR